MYVAMVKLKSVHLYIHIACVYTCVCVCVYVWCVLVCYTSLLHGVIISSNNARCSFWCGSVSYLPPPHTLCPLTSDSQKLALLIN